MQEKVVVTSSLNISLSVQVAGVFACKSLLFIESADSDSLAEIRYTLSATIVLVNGSRSSSSVSRTQQQQQYPTLSRRSCTWPRMESTMTQSPRMAATTTTITTANPACVVHPQGFPVRDGDNCCPLRRWWNRGTIRLGREADLSVYSSGDIMTVHVTIDHPVSVEAQVVQVTCLETVTR
jgi:hypothetical protein